MSTVPLKFPILEEWVNDMICDLCTYVSKNVYRKTVKALSKSLLRTRTFEHYLENEKTLSKITSEKSKCRSILKLWEINNIELSSDSIIIQVKVNGSLNF